LPTLRSAEPLRMEALAGLDAEVTMEAARVEAGGVVLEEAAGTLRLAEARASLDSIRAKLAGGTLEAALGIDLPSGAPPRLSLELKLEEATLASPLLGLPYDIAAGRGKVAAALTATGHAPAALLGSLSGSFAAVLRDGVMTGTDIGAAAAATGLAELPEAQATARRALASGATAFERLEIGGSLEDGQLRLTTGQVTTETGATATLSGSADLGRGRLDLRLGVRPSAAEAPDLGLRVTGPAAAPNALPETADWARWRAERG
jgi:uncharacterized protein involved in outer membrane biogenesis